MTRSRRTQILIMVAACLLTLALPSASGTERSTGGLVADSSYGGDGIAEMGSTCDEPAYPETNGPAGEVYVLVLCGHRVQLAALDPDGYPLAGFGTDGVVRVPLPTGWRHVEVVGLAVQPSGRVTVGLRKTTRNLECRFRTAVIRLAPDGSVDQTFGQGGTTVISHKRRWYGCSEDFMAVDQRGRTLLLHPDSTHEQGLEVVRLRPDGSLDRRFGGDGRVVRYLGRGTIDARDVRAVVWDGATTYVVSYATVPWKPGWVRPAVAVVRLTRHGRIDQRFGKRNGRAVIPLPNGSGATIDGAIDPRGRLIVSAHDQNSPDNRTWTLVRRLTSTGRVDRRFARHAGTIRTRVPTEQVSFGLVGARPVVVLSKTGRRNQEIVQVHGFTASGRAWSVLGAGGVSSLTASSPSYTDWSSMSSAGLFEVSSCYCSDPVRAKRFVMASR